MDLTLQRLQFDPNVTIGQLSFHGDPWTCWTCEDAVRNGPKVHGATAIPAGTYRVGVSWSPKFERDLPLLLDVPGFTGIRIHVGNTAEDTEGCILVGLDRWPNGVGRSKFALAQLFPKLAEALRRSEPISMTIRNSRPVV